MQKNEEILFNDLPEPIKVYIKHLERVRSDFVANVSHELRTPLTVIQGYLETLLKYNFEEDMPWKKIFSQMHQHSLRMANIIEDLLLLSRLESDDHPANERKRIHVDELLKALCVDAHNISGPKNHQFILQSDSRVTLDGSEEELRSLFSNIIINAVKYTPQDGTISISWFCDENNRAIFKVSDTGIGISKEDIPKITERFYRVDKGRSRESGGTGLGLAIVKHVLLRHHGELLIESELGKGSTFICIFPAERSGLNQI